MNLPRDAQEIYRNIMLRFLKQQTTSNGTRQEPSKMPAATHGTGNYTTHMATKTNQTQTTVTILGAGYVGLTTAVVLAHSGHTVYVVEPNEARLKIIRTGASFFFEEGLDTLISHAIDSGNLIPTNSYEESVPNSSVIFSCVGTPDNPDGSSNLTYVYAAATQTATLANEGVVYAQKSTVPVGTGKKIEQLFKNARKKIDYISNPEFLREGTAIYDTLFFDRVVVGGDSRRAIDTITNIYRGIEQSRDHIAHIAHVPIDPRGNQYIATTLNSAELIKVTSNAFLALKISFANSIALLADQANADILEVMDAVGADTRIGRSFLQAGRGYGGGCFPKDVSGLISSGLEHGIDLEILHAAQAVNNAMPGYIVDKLQDTLDGSLENKKVAVLGLAFKANTSDVRRSPGIAIANTLRGSGAHVTAYDPEAKYEATNDLYNGIVIVDSIDTAIKNADAVLITTEWSTILNYPAEQFAKRMSGTVLFDTVNQYNTEAAKNAGLTYIGIGHNTDTSHLV